ncbi:MAG: hypothetical protein PHX74_08375 [Candidatus Sumerlaeales bacterium]|nr:hypothetical protein [Candidatus Sumerlaeales bacterium]
MAGLRATIDVTGLDVFTEILVIVQDIVHDIDVPDRHKKQIQQWVENHRTDYALEEAIEIRASHAICPLCGMGKRYEQR